MLCQGLHALPGLPGVQRVSRHHRKPSEGAQDTHSCNELGQALVPDKDAYHRNLKCWETGVAH